MAPLVLPNNFKFKYFFGAQILVKNLVPSIPNSCNVYESNSIDEQRNILHDLELHSSSPQIFDINPDAMLETIIINVDDECALAPKTYKKVMIDVNYKSQEIWAVKMPWAELNFNEAGVVFAMRCDNVCTKIERKEEIFVVKWDFIEKHVGKRKGSNGKWIMDPKGMHVKNEISYAQLSTTIVLQ
jgi:hypothetical protein